MSNKEDQNTLFDTKLVLPIRKKPAEFPGKLRLRRMPDFQNQKSYILIEGKTKRMKLSGTER